MTVVPFEGAARLHLLDASDKTQVLVKSALLPIQEGATYKLSAQLNVLKQSHSVEIGMRYYDAAGKTQTLYKNSLLKGLEGKGWSPIELEVTAPAKSGFVELVFSSGAISLTEFYLDEVKLLKKNDEQPGEEIAQKLLNPGFELPVENGVIPGWTPENGAAGIAVSAAQAYTGAYSLHLHDTSDQAGLRVLSGKFAVLPGKAYVAKAMTYVIEQTHRIVYEIYYYGADGAQIGPAKIELFSNLPREKWSELRVFTEAPAGAAAARVAFYSGEPSLTEAYFDEVSFEPEAEDIPLNREYAPAEKLGEMVYVGLGQAAAIQENALGESEVYYHSNGKPGTFSVLDAETGELKFSQVVPNTEAVWAMTTSPDKNVYFAGTADGKLYRYLPEQRKLEDLGSNPSDNWVWDLEAAPDGKLYGSTYPHASVFEYDPATRKFRDYGPVVAGQQYARGLAVTDTDIYVGTGTTKHLIKIDRVTGAKEEIPVEGHTGKEDGSMIENVFVMNGKLLISAGSVTMLVMDPVTNRIENSFKYSNMVSEPSPYNPDLIYYKFETKLYQYNFRTNQTAEIEGIPPRPDTVRVKDAKWIQLKSGEKAGRKVLAMVTQYGEYMLFDPADRWLSFVKLDISAQSVAIQSLEAGPDGNLYMGGYQRGMSVYNPFTGKIEASQPTFAQPEGIGFLDGKVYFGTYVGAVMYSYDHKQPLEIGTNPKLEYDIGDQQDRPFAITSGDGKLFVGTIPDYGILGGALAIYDQASDKWSSSATLCRTKASSASLTGTASCTEAPRCGEGSASSRLRRKPSCSSGT
ncbi:hypothetical protein J31TS4_05350 [Paenibacillus sp. J31TS4]|uniref:WD40 repeat domain-containing protein n=1 Tax=Paenibacillus sp. J31TS4 TaxID=2807195 RepID=UPI001B27CA0C|nr:WD40 repeat domain-containing protein [Paenibacillus sp. J31TS4]GIP37255.1 hypothetical protein J31TS4_05350 [Paenibacillus sp. J31TS4]